MNDPFRVWEYCNAPAELQKVGSPDDADWIAELPPDNSDRTFPEWIYSDQFGRFETKIEPHPVKPGWRVAIGYHA